MAGTRPGSIGLPSNMRYCNPTWQIITLISHIRSYPPSCSQLLPQSHFLFNNSTIIAELKVQLSFSIFPTHNHVSSATTLVSVRNTRVFRTALTALTEPRTLWRRITHYPSSRQRVALHTYSFTLWWCLRTIRRIHVLRSSQGLQLYWSRLHNAWRC